MVKKQIIRDIVQSYTKTRVEAGMFFISWNGVPTLAYRGFSPVLLNIKQDISTQLPYLREENPGSGWPKTTLGALDDGITLSMKDLVTLKDICDAMNPGVQPYVITIANLDLVLYSCRSLEQRLMTESIPLTGPQDPSPPPQDHIDEVSGIMDQFSRNHLQDYLPYVQKEGHRISHYREPVIEATLVHDLVQVPSPVMEFRVEVDRQLPGLYCWFDDASLHMTVRALV
jgi:hypothetical protein